MLRIVESSDVRDDGWLALGGLREIGVVQGVRTERHLLRPFDVLVTARTGSVQVALVPPEVSRTVAGVTLLVVRPKHLESGMGHWLWYCLTSSNGRAQLSKRMTVSATLRSLSARSLGEVRSPCRPRVISIRWPDLWRRRRRRMHRRSKPPGCAVRRSETRWYMRLTAGPYRQPRGEAYDVDQTGA